MRILASCHRMDWTGAPIILFKLLGALARRHEVTLLRVTDAPAGGPLEPLYVEAGVTVRDTARIADFDVFIGNTLKRDTSVIRAARVIPTLWWIHEPRAGRLYIDQGKVALDAFRAADIVCFPTEWQRETLYRPFLGDTESVVVPYGIEPVTDAYPRPGGLPPDGFHLVSLGYLSPRKGQMQAIDALSRLRDPAIHLHLLGSPDTVPDHAGKIRDRLAGDPFLAARVHLHGSVPQETVAGFLAHGDALVFPTRDDLITMSILEALSHRTLVISSDFGPIPETITDGETGLLFPVGDAAALAEKIAFAAAHPAAHRRLAYAGFAASRKRHDFTAHVAAMEAALERAMAKRRGASPPSS